MADEQRRDRGGARKPGGSGAPRSGASRKPSGPRSPADGSADRSSRDGDAKRPFRDGDAKRPRRDGDAKRPYRDGDAKRPYRDGDAKRPYRDGDGKRPYRDGKPQRGGRDGRPARPGHDDRPRRSSRPPQSSDRRASDEPEIPEAITPRDLAPAARNELKTLSKENADEVARHLAMAAALIDDDPALALRHAQAASRRAGRIAVVRETVAIAAYATGDFALALRELRTYRRISGRDDQIALMVDSERGVGRADRALEVGRAVDRAALPAAVRVELAIALSGARLDLGQTERALLELDIPELDPSRAFPWSPALFSARAAVLEDLGREAEAAQWRERADVAAEALDASSPLDDVIVVEEIEEIEGDGDADDAAEGGTAS